MARTPQGVPDLDALSSSQLNASDTLCLRAPDSLYALARRVGVGFAVAVAVWTSRAREQVGLRLGRASTGVGPAGLVELFAVLDVQELAEQVTIYRCRCRRAGVGRASR